MTAVSQGDSVASMALVRAGSVAVTVKASFLDAKISLSIQRSGLPALRCSSRRGRRA